MTSRREQFRRTILWKLKAVAKPDCAECHGDGVVDCGRGEDEELYVCACVAIDPNAEDRERGDDDGSQYADPRDERDERER